MLREYGNAPSALGDSAEGIQKASDSELDGPAISQIELLGSDPMSSMCGTVVV
jgi:hypothetical protein